MRRFLAVALFLAPFFVPSSAPAAETLLSNGATKPVEQRIAVAVSSSRSTIWTSLKLDAEAGPVGIVVPVSPGASLDVASDAWFEALEVATATRVFPPEGKESTCPGTPDDPESFHMTGDVSHTASLAPDEITVLPDGPAVEAWAAQHGLGMMPDVARHLGALSGKRFLVARFTAPAGQSVTPTIRVVTDSGEASLPLAITRAGSERLRVSAWLLGPGLGGVSGGVSAKVPASELVWNAATKTTNFEARLAEALDAAGPGASYTEAAGHDVLSSSLAIANGTAAIDGLLVAYFERAAAYGDGETATALCSAKAAAALASSALVSTTCPRADLGVVDGVVACDETVEAGEIDPEKLRCGDGADDLAVALSGLAPAEVWLTRLDLAIPEGQWGETRPLGFGGDTPVLPITTSTSIDLGDCGGKDGGAGSTGSGTTGGGKQSGGSSGGSRRGSSKTTVVVDHSADLYVDSGCSCSGTSDTVTIDDGGEYVEEDSSSEDDCGGDSSGSSGDDCGGDTTETSGSSDDCGGDSSGGDDCSGDSGGGDDCSGDSGGDSCSGSEGGDSCDSGGGGDSCDSGGGSGCDGGSGSDCSVVRNGTRRPRGPRLSAMTLAALALLAPLRRAGRRKRPREALRKAS